MGKNALSENGNVAIETSDRGMDILEQDVNDGK